MKLKKKIILFDFDGVIHSYKSGWKGTRCIPDPPVSGAIEFLVELIDGNEYDVCIYSSRSKQFGGRRAMKKWLSQWFFKLVDISWEQQNAAIKSWINSHWDFEGPRKLLLKPLNFQ